MTPKQFQAFENELLDFIALHQKITCKELEQKYWERFHDLSQVRQAILHLAEQGKISLEGNSIFPSSSTKLKDSYE